MSFSNKAIKWLISAFVLPLSLTVNAADDFVDPANYAWLAYNSSAASYMPLENNSFIQNGFLMKNWSTTRINVPGRCAHGLVKDGELCYPACREGYQGVGPVCWENCPEGYTNDGMTCRRDRTHAKGSYGRGVGTIPPCRNGKVNDAGLCYPACEEGYKGVGPVCWRQCEAGLVDTGAICQDPSVHVFGRGSYGRGAGKPIIITHYEDVYDEMACYNSGWEGFSADSGEEQGYTVARNDREKITVFAFRGTANVDNILTDVDFTPHNMVIGGKTVWLHSGFWRNFNSVAAEVQQALEETPADHKVIVTGHSLGASVASIAAPHFTQWGRKPDAVVLFASPLTGDGRFKDAYRQLVGCNRTLRIGATADIINDIPEVYSYTHVCDATEAKYDKDVISNHDMFLGYANVMEKMFNPTSTNSTLSCPAESVVLFDDRNYQGNQIAVDQTVMSLGSMNYSMSSFIVPNGWTARLYEWQNLLGASEGRYYTRTSSETYATGFDNKVQSVEILKSPLMLGLFDGNQQQGGSIYLSENSPNLGAFSNKLSSYAIPSGWTVRFFEGVNYQGNYYTRSDGKANATDFDNRIRSVQILSKNNGVVTMWDGQNQTGASLSLSENTPDLGHFNLKMSSFAIPEKWTVRFYEGLNYEGRYYTRSAGRHNATDFNNKVRSMQILIKDK